MLWTATRYKVWHMYSYLRPGRYSRKLISASVSLSVKWDYPHPLKKKKKEEEVRYVSLYVNYYLYVNYLGLPWWLKIVKNLLAVWEARVQSLGWEDSLEKGMGTHSSILAWRIPRTEEPGGLPSMRLQRVGQDWSNLSHNTHANYKRMWDITFTYNHNPYYLRGKKY